MKKIINSGATVVTEMIDGYVKAYPRYFERLTNDEGEINAIAWKNRSKDKVALVIGGGSGHEPLFAGLCGEGMADAAIMGNIFAAPNPQLICDTAKACDNGKGVLFIYGNYAGDNLNFDMGEELCEFEDITTAHVRVYDDIASFGKDRMDERRGIAGDVYVIKIAAAACAAGLSLEEVKRVTEKARDNIFTIGLAIGPGTHPVTGALTFELPDDAIEYGLGLHGEPGVERTTMKPADELTERMFSELMKEMELKEGEEISVLVNSLGATTILELCVVNRKLNALLNEKGIKIHDCELQTLCTCQEMSGFSITFLRMDEELKKYYNTPCYTPYFSRGAIE